MTQQQQPNNTTPDPWDAAHAAPLSHGQNSFNGADLYAHKPKAGEGLGLAFSWMAHPAAFPVILTGLVLMAGIAAYSSWQDGKRAEARAIAAQVDMDVFKKSNAAIGFARTCLATEVKHVPLQYFLECQAIVKAHARAKGAKQ